MTPEQRLGEIVTALESVGISCLVMGGHAVRFYGLVRNTNDFDIHIAPDYWDELGERLNRTSLGNGTLIEEGPSWRPHSFKRFRIGTLSSGADEWLEFWKENHLLEPFGQLFNRAQIGLYGSRKIAFLGLSDLIRSKETERDRDWQDVSRLEEMLDDRFHSALNHGDVALKYALAELRSRAGFGLHMMKHGFTESDQVCAALELARNPVTHAFLLPFATDVSLVSTGVMLIEPMIENRLRQITGGSQLHLSLVEIVRRRYIAFRKEEDHKDKALILSRQKAD